MASHDVNSHSLFPYMKWGFFLYEIGCFYDFSFISSFHYICYDVLVRLFYIYPAEHLLNFLAL